MHKSFLHSSRRRWLPAAGILGAFPLLCVGQGLRAQTASAAASAGADPTASAFYTSGSYFDVEGSGTTTHAEFGVLDFPTSLLDPSGQTASGVQNNQLTLQFTESNAAFTAPSTLEFYLTTATGTATPPVSIASGSPLRYQTSTDTATAPTPYGIDPLLGSLGGSGSTALFDLGTGTTSSTGTTGSGTVDTYTLTLSTSALSAFLGELNTASGTVRLVAAVTNATPNGAATFAGPTNSTTASRPLLSFVPIFSVGNPKYWQGGNGGSWTPNSTNFGSTATTTGTAWDNGGTATAIFANTANTVNINAGNINAAGLEFDVTGYTVNGTGPGNTLTLTGSHTMNVVNATDTATVNVPVAGTVGLAKIGSGTLVLGGQNTYSGGTTVTGGTLSVSADANLGASGEAVALSGGTLAVTGSNLTMVRAFSGSGGISIAANNTLTVSGVFNAGTVTLSGAGTLSLTGGGNTLNNGGDFNFTGLVFQAAGASLLTADPNTGSPGLGITNLGAGGIAATQASGAVSASSLFQVAGTVPINVANAGATLTLAGSFSGGAVLAKTGAGTLVINTDNSALTGYASSSTATPTSFRQGSAGTTAATGGVVSITATTPNPGNALGTGEFQANGGTISNDTGAALALAISDISLGARDSTGTPGGLVFAGSAPITVAGNVSLYKGTTNAYQHAITVNTPTTFSGVFLLSATTTTSTGVTILGSSTLTLSGTAANTFTEPVTIATSGTGAGVVAAKDGAFGANTSITLNAGAKLTINTGVTTGTVNAINDAGLLAFNSSSGTFGQVVLSIGGAKETVGGLYLAASDGVLPAGYQPAGTYGPTGSPAGTIIDNNLFSGTGVIMNLGTAVPEPSTWTVLLLGGLGGLAAIIGRRARGGRSA